MRHLFAVLMLLASVPLFAQEDCDVFNIQELSAAYLNFSVDSTILHSDGSFEVYLSNGTTYTLVPGCTDPDYTEYDASANVDDGSCATLPSTCGEVEMDGYTYSVVEIGDQCWFAENLRTTVYADDSSIPEVYGYSAWTGLSTDARCNYGNNAYYAGTYGRLYNWYAVDNANGLCPSGWHVPTDGEWTALEDYITAQGFNGTEGTALKSTGDWDGGGNGTDNFGFSALPGGYRGTYYGIFHNAGGLGFWWSSSSNGGDAWGRSMSNSNPGIFRDDYSPRSGFSVRCLRDAD
jgi:uncharacterized protein (TIGR02145 family)